MRLTAQQRARRDRRVVDLFLAGVSHRQIASTVGLSSHYAVQKILKRDLDERMAQRQVVSETAVLSARQDELLAAHWEAAKAGDPQSVRVVLQVLRMMEKSVERAQLASAVSEVVDAEVVDEEPQQRALGEARRLRVVPDVGDGTDVDGRDLDWWRAEHARAHQESIAAARARSFIADA